MKDVRFSEPIKVEVNPSGSRTVATSWEALECLRDQWPERARGRTYRAAWRACRDALDGWRAPKEARRAFLKAARRAGLIASERRPR